MIDRSDAPDPGRPANLNALALNLTGLLLLFGGGLMLGLLALVEHMPPVVRDGGLGYAVPGTGGRHLIDAKIGYVLGGLGGFLTVAGALGLLAARLFSRRPTRPLLVEAAAVAHRPANRRRHPVLIPVLGAAALAAALLYRRYG